MSRRQETPREKWERMARLGSVQSAAGPLGRGEMGASSRFIEGQANGLSVFLKANAGGGLERGQGNLGGTKTNRGGPIVLGKDAGGRGSTPDQGQAKKSSQSPTTGRRVSERSTKHSTSPHRTPCVHVYAPAKQKSNGETARPRGPVIMGRACTAFLLDVDGSVR